MTDLESPKKNNDCYFYYYSTCSKGDSCGFRHEPSALGCETICSFWKEGKCVNVHCNFRHMELRKNRKAIPCYWESQPGGCLKPHCPFMHQNATHPTSENEGKSNKSETNLPENCNQAGNFKSTSSVDSLVVNFEEESDSESAPTSSPAKTGTPKVKTLEEIKLEKIAAACAAYYSYPSDGIEDDIKPQLLSGDDLRQRILQRVKSKETSSQRIDRKLSRGELAHILGDESLKLPNTNFSEDSLTPDLDTFPRHKRRKMADEETVQNIKIKTLEEIRAERNAQKEIYTTEKVDVNKRKHSPIRLDRRKMLKTSERNTSKAQNDVDEAEVSSTSNDEPESQSERLKPLKPLRKLNLKKVKSEDANPHENISNISNKSPKKLEISHQEQPRLAVSEALVSSQANSVSDASKDECSGVADNRDIELERSNSNKSIDESVLLLDDPEEDLNVNLKGEDDLLNEIDSLLND